jgi:hypothetical protein
METSSGSELDYCTDGRTKSESSSLEKHALLHACDGLAEECPTATSVSSRVFLLLPFLQIKPVALHEAITIARSGDTTS